MWRFYNDIFSLVKEAVSLNKKLQYVNSHQLCLLDESRKELNRRCEELTEAKVCLYYVSVIIQSGVHTGFYVRVGIVLIM